MDLGAYLFSFVLETIPMVYVGPTLLGHRLPNKVILALGTALGLLTLGVRQFYYHQGIPLGTHTLVFAVLMVLLLRYGGGLGLGLAAAATLVSLILVLLGGLLVSLPGIRDLAKGILRDPIPKAGPWLAVNLVEKSVLLSVAALVWRRGRSR